MCRQLYENWKNQSGASLSVIFLLIWLLGDIFAIAGLILVHGESFQLVLASYYAIVDSLLIAQGFFGLCMTLVFYYERYNVQLCAHSDEEVDPLMHELHTPLSVEVNAPQTKSKNSSRFFLLGLLPWGVVHALPASNVRFNTRRIVADSCGWLSAALYIGSRVPQIYKNVGGRLCYFSPSSFN